MVRKVSMTGGARDAGIVPDREGGREVPEREVGRAQNCPRLEKCPWHAARFSDA